MLERIKKLLGIKTCGHKWEIYHNAKYKHGITKYDIYQNCWKCGKRNKINSVSFIYIASLISFLKHIKAQNPEYYVIGVEG
jgi:hypothetical protein